MDTLVEGARVRWDASHEQYWSLDTFGHFSGLAERRSYEVEPIDSFGKTVVSDADGLVITTPPRAFNPDELAALAAFVEDGGALFLHDQANFRGLDETDNLNTIAERLDLTFRFNDDAANAGAPFEPLTTEYNAALFGA